RASLLPGAAAASPRGARPIVARAAYGGPRGAGTEWTSTCQRPRGSAPNARQMLRPAWEYGRRAVKASAGAHGPTVDTGSARKGRPRRPPPAGLFGRLRHVAGDDEPARAGPDLDGLPVLDLAAEELLGERVLQLALDHPLQRPRAVDGVVAGLGEPGLAGPV